MLNNIKIANEVRLAHPVPLTPDERYDMIDNLLTVMRLCKQYIADLYLDIDSVLADVTRDLVVEKMDDALVCGRSILDQCSISAHETYREAFILHLRYIRNEPDERIPAVDHWFKEFMDTSEYLLELDRVVFEPTFFPPFSDDEDSSSDSDGDSLPSLESIPRPQPPVSLNEDPAPPYELGVRPPPPQQLSAWDRFKFVASETAASLVLCGLVSHPLAIALPALAAAFRYVGNCNPDDTVNIFGRQVQPYSPSLINFSRAEWGRFSNIIFADSMSDRLSNFLDNAPTTVLCMWCLGLVCVPLSLFVGNSIALALFSSFLYLHLFFLSLCVYWAKPETVNTLLFVSLSMSIITGLPLIWHLFYGVLPATSEERMKRMLSSRFGVTGVAIFSGMEMIAFTILLGFSYPIVAARFMVALLHHYWAYLDEDEGITCHYTWNLTPFWIFWLTASKMSGSYLELFDVLGFPVWYTVVAWIAIILLLSFLSLYYYYRCPVDAVAQGSPFLTADDYFVRGNDLYYHKSLCKKYPDLHRFREWEKCYREGIRSFFGRKRGEKYNVDLVRRHYLLIILYMRTNKPNYLGEIHALQSMIEARATPVIAQSLDIVSVTDGLNIATGHAQLAIITAKVLTFAYYGCEVPVWVAGFSDLAPTYARTLATVFESIPESEVLTLTEQLKGWFGVPFIEAQSSITDFFESPLYSAFVRLLTSVFFSSVLGEVLSPEAITSVKKYTNIFALLQDLASLLEMSATTIIDYVTCGRVSGYVMGFSTLESQVDEMLSRPLPECSHPDYPSIREAYLRELSSRMEALANMSRKNMELSSRYQACCRKAEEVKARVVRPALSRAPDILMFVGAAGSGKSTICRTFVESYVLRHGNIPKETPANSFVHTYRSNGQKHAGDAIAKPTDVKGFIFDDFQQNRAQAELCAAELGLLHSMAGEERTAISFASLEGKALANQLAPLVVAGATNSHRVFEQDFNFDRPSLARRVDVVIDCVNRTGVEFSSTHLPGEEDVEFTFSKLRYVDNQPDPVRVPFNLVKLPNGQSTNCTNNRRLALLSLMTFCDASRVSKDAVYQEKISGTKCRLSGFSPSEHYGKKCGPECTIEGLAENDGIAFMPLAQGPPPNEIPFVACALVAVLYWFVWYIGLAACVLMLIHIYLVRFHKRTLYGYSLEAISVAYMYLLPLFFFTCKAYFEYKVLKVSSSWDNLCKEFRERGVTYTAIRLRVGPELAQRVRRAAALLATIAACAVTYKAFRVTMQARQEADLNQLPKVDLNQHSTLQEKRQLMQMRRSIARFSGRIDDVKLIAKSCLCEVHIVDNGVPKRTSFALVTQNVCLIPTHCVYTNKTLNFSPVLQTGNPLSPQAHRFVYIDSIKSRVSYPGLDISRLELSGSNPNKDLSPHFLTSDLIKNFQGSGFVFIRGEWHEARNINYIQNYNVCGVNTPITYGFSYDIVDFIPEVGDCGSVVVCVTSTGTAFILGIHHAAIAGTSRSMGQFVTREMLQGYTAQGGEVVEEDSNTEFDVTPPWPTYSVSNPLPPLVDPDMDKTTSYLGINATMIGSIDRKSSRVSCSIRPSKIAEFFPEGGESKYGIPWFKDKKVNGEWKGPYYTLGEAKPEYLDVDPVAASRAFDDLKLDYDFYREHLKDVHPLPLEQAINGIPGVFKSMNIDTSCGHPFMGTKKSDHVINVGTEKNPCYELKPEILKDVSDYLGCPEAPPIVVESCMKVEVRPIEKLHKTRFFTVFPFFFLVLFRVFVSYVLSIWRRFMSQSETLIGCNAAGQDWNVLGESLDGPRDGEWCFMAFDFVKYDKRFPVLLKEIVYTYFKGLFYLTAYTPEFISIVLKLFTSLFTIFIIIINEVFFINAWNHSGDPITVETNSVGQRFLFRYWFYKMLPHMPVGSFRNWVVLWTYGDDSLARVRRHPLLTQLTFAKCCADWGMEVTSSTKGELTEYMERADLTFLKRGIVKDDDFNGYRAPLDENSIYKMLCWFDTKSALTEEMWISAVVNNASREWFLHGRERFEKETARLMEVCEKVGVLYPGETWDYCMEQYKASTFATWDL